MGTNYQGEEHGDAIIPKVMDTIFSRVECMKESTEFVIRVSLIEVFKEDIFDLLDRSARVSIQIRETVSGAIALAGVTEPEVRTKDEMSSFFLQGSLSRATGSTEMNSQSSRSHAIFTNSMGQRRCGDDVLMVKLHLVDLAGSERAKRAGAHGSRLQEGIHINKGLLALEMYINKGLLALGNVISALGDKKRKGGHIPYRDHKLTRILQDSLGGNCKTIMIACVSPANINAEETLNSLKYANRAKNILNKAIINRDPMTAEMQKMQSQIEELQSELLHSSLATEEIKILKDKVSLLEASKIELQQALQDCRISCQHLQQRAIDAQMEKDRLVMKIESIRNEINGESDKYFDLLKSYITRIQELECELVIIRSSNQLRRWDSDDFLYSRDYGSLPRNLFMDSDIRTEETLGVVEDVEKELQHSSIREHLDRELKELDQRLEQKEKEIDELRHNLANISSNSDDSAQKLKEEYLQKLNTLELQVAQLKKKQDAQAQLLRQKLKGDEAAKRLQDDIQRIKTQKEKKNQKIET